MTFTEEGIKKIGKNQEDIYAYQWGSILDGETCNYCISIDGSTILATDERFHSYQPGRVHSGCRCIWVAILKDDTPLPSLTGIPRSLKPQTEVPPWDFKDLDSPLPGSSSLNIEERLYGNLFKEKGQDKRAWELFDYGRRLEKINLDESIEAYKEIVTNSLDRGSAYLLDVYLRLSVCYEKKKRYTDCLEIIRNAYIENNMRIFHGLTKRDIETLSKRFDRCKKKCPQYSKVLPNLFNLNKWLGVLYKWDFNNEDWEKVSSDFTEKFGKRPLLNDVAWVLFNKAVLTNKNLNILYNYMADFIEEENRPGSEKLRHLASKYKGPEY